MSDAPIYDETAWAHGFAPMPHEPACPCAADIAARLRDPDDELTVVRYTAHSPALHNWPPDIRGIA